MNAAVVRAAARYLGAWGAIVLCVILLSLLFTFLGTITCAVLAGMMMGAFKGTRWFSVSVSLVFPAVIFGITGGAKVELTQHQVIVLAALCFGTFWATYAVSAYMFFCEQKARKPVVQCAPALPAEPAVPDGMSAAANTTVHSFLDDLQGDWVREASANGGANCRKVIHITDSKLELEEVDTNGHITLLARGDVTLQSVS